VSAAGCRSSHCGVTDLGLGQRSGNSLGQLAPDRVRSLEPIRPHPEVKREPLSPKRWSKPPGRLRATRPGAARYAHTNSFTRRIAGRGRSDAEVDAESAVRVVQFVTFSVTSCALGMNTSGPSTFARTGSDPDVTNLALDIPTCTTSPTRMVARTAGSTPRQKLFTTVCKPNPTPTPKAPTRIVTFVRSSPETLPPRRTRPAGSRSAPGSPRRGARPRETHARENVSFEHGANRGGENKGRPRGRPKEQDVAEGDLDCSPSESRVQYGAGKGDRVARNRRRGQGTKSQVTNPIQVRATPARFST